MLTAGKEATAKLPARATEIQTLMSSWATESLAQKQTTFEAFVASSPGAVNADVAAVVSMVLEQAALTIEDIKALEMWLLMKTPEISDGNNFGVDVQQYVLGELAKIKAEVITMLAVVSDYHSGRAAALEKIVRPTTKTVDEESKTAKDKDGKTEVTSSKTEKASSKDEPPLPDYVKQAAALDVKAYHGAYLKLTDLRNAYFKAHLLMSKNKKRLTDPRGDGEGARSNSMSMF